MVKIAFVDLDGVVADSTLRFERAKAARDVLRPLDYQEADKVYWQTAFTPDLVYLDTPMPGVVEALEQIEKTYQILYLTSRPESMRAATEAWLIKYGLMLDAVRFPRELILKASGFQFVKTVVWKVGMIEQLAALYGASHVLFWRMRRRSGKRYSKLIYQIEDCSLLAVCQRL